MIINVEVNESDVRRVIARHISDVTGQEVSADRVVVEVKSKQNYKAEWENAAFRVTYTKII